jgi:predicted DNA-binding transcriptional regulator AlpA
MLGVSRQRAHKIAQRPDFPAPVVRLSSGAVWERAAVEAWMRATGRIDEL